MKEKIRKECYRRVRAIIHTELNAQNKLKSNQQTGNIFNHLQFVINWNLEEIRRIHRKIRKLLTLNRMHHPKADVNRTYVARKKGGRTIINLEMCFKTTAIGLNTYLLPSDDRMLKLVLKHEKKLHSVMKESQKFKFQLNTVQEENEQTTEATKAAKEIKKKAKQGYLDDMKKTWTEKPSHGRYLLQTDIGDVDRATTQQWLSSSSLKGESEGFILAAQNQILAKRMYQAKILKNGADSRCQLRTHSEETTDNMISGCPTIVNTEYFQRHD